MASANVDLVRSIWASWEHGDFSRVEWADPDIKYAFHDGPEPGRWRGVAHMGRAWFRSLEAWESYSGVAEEYRELDRGRVLILTRVAGRGRSSGLELDQFVGSRGALLFELRDGKVTQLDVYWDRDRVFADLGLER